MPGKIASNLRPVPVPDDLTRPFWEAAKERRLVIQQCQKCKTYWHPPQYQCQTCESRDLKWEPVSGKGSIYSYTRIHDSPLKAFLPALPYCVVHVELAEQPWLLYTCNMASTDLDDIRIGAPVEVMFEEISRGMLLPDFQIARPRS